MIKRLLGALAAACALLYAGCALAQPVSSAPLGTSVPTYAICYGTLNFTCVNVDALHVLPAGRPDVSAVGSVNSATLNAAYTIPVSGGGSAAFTVTGLTASAATLALEGSNDGGTTWTSAKNIDAVSTFVSDGQFRVNAAGRTHLRLRVSVTGTGTISFASNISGASTDVDPSNAAFSGETAISSLDTAYAAGRSLKAICTVAGDVSVTYTDTSTGTWAASVGNQTFPIAATKVNSTGTTATCTYFNLR